MQSTPACHVPLLIHSTSYTTATTSEQINTDQARPRASPASPFPIIGHLRALSDQPGEPDGSRRLLKQTTAHVANGRRQRVQVLLTCHDADLPCRRTPTQLDLDRTSTLQLAPSRASLVPERHALQVIQQTPPVVGEHLGILDPLLRPVLVPPRHVVLRVLKVNKLVAETLLDEHGPVVLVDNRLLVLHTSRQYGRRRRGRGVTSCLP